MEKQSVMSSKYTAISGVLVLFGLYLTSRYSYLLFHSLAEVFSIVVACGIFMVAINSRQFLDNNYFLFIGIAYLFIGGLDLVHTLAYANMGVFVGYDANLPTQLWIGSRYIESISLLIAFLFIGRRKLKHYFVFIGYAVVISLLLGSIFYRGIFPDCFIEGAGLTLFKKISEYIISLILVSSIFLLYQNRRRFDTGVFQLLVASIIVTVASELAFTFYVSVYGLSNLIGHFCKIVSFYLIYKAIIEIGLTKPYSLVFRDLKQREESLKESEGRWRSLVENAPEKILTVDRDGIILFINRTSPGRTVEGVLGTSVYNYLPPDVQDKTKQVLELVFQSGKTDEYESTIVRDDGTKVMYKNSTAPIKRKGQIVAAICIATDITDRVHVEEELQEQTYQLGKRVKELNCLYGICNLVGEPGISLDGILQGTVELIPPAWQYPEITCARIIMDGQESARTDSFEETTWKQGCDIIVHGERIGVLEVCYLEERPESDEGPFLKEERSLLNTIAKRLGRIIERMLAEEEIKKQGEFLNSAIESLNHPFYVIDADNYTIKMANSAARIDSLTEEPTCYALTHKNNEPCGGAEHICPLEEIKKTKEPVIVEHIHYDKDGNSRIVEVHGFPIFDNLGNVIQMIEYTLDITERKQAEDALRQAHSELAANAAQLREANAELEQYAYVVSHDLKAPLRAIHNYADFLREDLEDTLDGDQKVYLDGLNKAVRQGEELVDALLYLSRVGTRGDTIEPIDIGIFFQELIASLNLPEDAEVVMGSDWPTIDADWILLRQIFQNLITNAVKFNPSSRKLVEIGWRPVGEERYELFVRDNGIGIEADYLEQIFRVFRRLHTSEEYEGTGIGLAIVKKAVSRLHGSIRVESTPGEGSTFFVVLPKTGK